MKELKKLALSVKGKLDLQYNADAIEYLEGYIERVKPEFKDEDVSGLVNALGAFLGECIIFNYGGRWAIDTESNRPCVEFDDKNRCYPISKTQKQFDNGVEDSIYSFYIVIPTVFKVKNKTGFSALRSYLLRLFSR